MGHSYWAYIITNKSRDVLYTGMTNNIERRIAEHRSGETGGFSKKYNLQHLVYYEEFGTPIEAIAREKQLKRWKRDWKCKLVEEENPHWRDLAQGWEYRGW